jgi:predicted dehydrogenase
VGDAQQHYEEEEPQMLGLGVIGCGRMARELTLAVRDRVTGARVVTAFDTYAPAREAFCGEFGAAPAASVEELLAREGIGAVLVASPNFLHAEHVVAAARAGKHVFCEKPMALSVTDCDRMIAACDGAGVRLMVGQSTRLMPACLKLRELAASQELGPPLYGFVSYWFSGFLPRDSGVWHVERARSGGLFFQMAIHHIDLLHAIFGPARRVQYAGGQYGPQMKDFDDIATLLVEYRSGATAAIGTCGMTEAPSPGMHFLFQNGYAKMESAWGALEYGPSSEQRTVLPVDQLPSPSGVALELQSFTDWVLRGQNPVLTAAEGRAAVAVAEAAQRAKETGAAVEI